MHRLLSIMYSIMHDSLARGIRTLKKKGYCPHCTFNLIVSNVINSNCLFAVSNTCFKFSTFNLEFAKVFLDLLYNFFKQNTISIRLFFSFIVISNYVPFISSRIRTFPLDIKSFRQLWSTLYANSSIYLSFLQSGSATILEYFASDLVAGVLKVHDCIRNLHSDGINYGLNIKRANKSVSQKSEVIWNKKKRKKL